MVVSEEKVLHSKKKKECSVTQKNKKHEGTKIQEKETTPKNES